MSSTMLTFCSAHIQSHSSWGEASIRGRIRLHDGLVTLVKTYVSTVEHSQLASLTHYGTVLLLMHCYNVEFTILGLEPGHAI